MVSLHQVTADECDSRLDRWLKHYFQTYTHGQIEKLLRTGQVRVNSKRVKGNYRLVTTDQIRVPPLLPNHTNVKPNPTKTLPASTQDIADFTHWIIYEDAHLMAINKPAGLATQGGTKLIRHVDSILQTLAQEGTSSRLKLVHRLDKDTSGVLILAKTTKVAHQLGVGFRDRHIRKTYWGVGVGVPDSTTGRIDYPLSKQRLGREEKVVVDPNGEMAISLYQVIDQVADKVCWLALEPLTGRTHQLRVHLAALGIPLVGDYKYGNHQAFVLGLPKLLHLHAYSVDLSHVMGYSLAIKAPILSSAMQTTFTQFGWQERQFYALYPEKSF